MRFYENKSNLKIKLEKIETDIDQLKKTYGEIDVLSEKIIHLLNQYIESWEKFISLTKEGTPYHKALINMVFEKYIPNPELENEDIFLGIKKFFTDVPDWIINDEKNYKIEKDAYQKEWEKVLLKTKNEEYYEELKKIFFALDRYGSCSDEELAFFDLNPEDRADFKEAENIESKTFWGFYGKTFVKPEGCSLQGELVITNKDALEFQNKINEMKKKINSIDFKNNLDLNLNKLKNIIKKVSLNIRLGERNTANKKLNKILDKDLHKQRLEKHKIIKGYIYILTNKSFPNYIKIGSTMRDPSIRAQELSDTSVPFPYEVKFKILTKNCEILEKKVHAILDKKRVDLEREFFKCSILEAQNIIKEVVKNA